MYQCTMTDEILTDCELQRRYADALDEAYGYVMVAGISYQTSRALRLLDPISFQGGVLDWIDAQVESGDLIELDN